MGQPHGKIVFFLCYTVHNRISSIFYFILFYFILCMSKVFCVLFCMISFRRREREKFQSGTGAFSVDASGASGRTRIWFGKCWAAVPVAGQETR